MTTRRKSLLLLGSGLAATATSQPAAAGTAESPQLKLRVPASHADGEKRWLNIDAFHFVITNCSQERLGVWLDWNSWGWYCPKITIDIRDRRFEFAKKIMQWKRNFPSPFYIEPDDHYILPVNLLSNDWSQPIGFNPLRDVEALVSASFTITPDQATKAMKIWTGELKCETRVYLEKSKP